MDRWRNKFQTQTAIMSACQVDFRDPKAQIFWGTPKPRFFWGRSGVLSAQITRWLRRSILFAIVCQGISIPHVKGSWLGTLPER